ncbi:membrane-spanning 4-domains subfamily A member 4D-like isoform X2 [Apodemus sylvaticus]|uniref:membrane-spanning 4-domains subfamily A member 4D-like isoform X2 n=1 Tax=Apodemus sylvaticus TaxID=10129 RepID=UPI002241D313|nr:membrane-spanning 4-domains subfamily A member 4D-like isoform X2 [Apodemus sylvaticus]
MQGLEQTPMAVVPGGAQPSEKSVMKSQMWNEIKEEFLKGEPKVLGVVQVMIALINLSLGTIILTNIFAEPIISVVLLAPIWGPIMFIVSGSLSIAAGVKTTKSLVISSLTLNTISSVLAATASIMGIVSLALGSYSPFRYNNNTITRVLVVLPPNPTVTVMAPPMTLQPLLPLEQQGKNVPENLCKNYAGDIV